MYTNIRDPCTDAYEFVGGYAPGTSYSTSSSSISVNILTSSWSISANKSYGPSPTINSLPHQQQFQQQSQQQLPMNQNQMGTVKYELFVQQKIRKST